MVFDGTDKLYRALLKEVESTDDYLKTLLFR